MIFSLILSVAALFIVWLLLPNFSAKETIVRIGNGKIASSKGIIWKKERTLDLNGFHWIETQTVQGSYTSLMVPTDFFTDGVFDRARNSHVQVDQGNGCGQRPQLVQ